MSQAIQEPEKGAASLLADDEPRPFEIVNPEGCAPLLLVCDHASAFVPRALDKLGLGDESLRRHVAFDIGIAEVTRAVAATLDAPAVLSHFSRLIIDPNRALDDPTSVPQLSDDVVVPGNRNLGQAERLARAACFFTPYHRAIDESLDRLMRRGPRPAMVSMHSFTPIMKGRKRPWEIGILWNRDPRLPVPMMEHLAAQGIEVGDNEPYSGADYHGHTIHEHAEPRGIAHVLIEVRQDLIDTPAGQADWSARLSRTLGEVLKAADLESVWEPS